MIWALHYHLAPGEWPNPSIERTVVGKPPTAAHVERYVFKENRC